MRLSNGRGDGSNWESYQKNVLNLLVDSLEIPRVYYSAQWVKPTLKEIHKHNGAFNDAFEPQEDTKLIQ